MNHAAKQINIRSVYQQYALEEPGKLYLLFILFLLGAGALFSKFLISLSIFLLLPTIFVTCIRKSDTKLGLTFRKIAWTNIKSNFLQPPFFLFLLLFGATLLSAFLSSNLPNGLAKVQLRLPYLLLPLVFVFNNSFTRKDVYWMLFFFITLCAAVTLGVLINYSILFDRITESLSHGKSVPTPSNHIRYSLFVAFASLSGIYLFTRKYFPQKLNILMLILAVFLAIALHILAVRSGLFLFYLGGFYLLVTHLYQRVRKRILFPIILLAGFVPYLAYEFIPSLENRINYMIYDIQHYMEGDLGAFSDGDRIRSIIMGWELFKEYPLMGCGVGDIETATEKIYIANYAKGVNVRLAHNQLIYFLATTGIIGTLLSLPALLFPYFFQNRVEKTLIHLHGIVFLISCTIEATLEGTNGISFHLLFLLPLMSLNRDPIPNKFT
jgi:O-antigen ligase